PADEARWRHRLRRRRHALRLRRGGLHRRHASLRAARRGGRVGRAQHPRAPRWCVRESARPRGAALHVARPDPEATMRSPAALERAGIRIDGSRPFDIKLHDRAALRAYATQGLLGALQAYVDGLWDAEQLDEL